MKIERNKVMFCDNKIGITYSNQLLTRWSRSIKLSIDHLVYKVENKKENGIFCKNGQLQVKETLRTKI